MSLRILVTAGPTREPIDPVRFLSNRSSGKMGYAIAAAAVARGHDVELVSGPVELDCPGGARLHLIETAEEMFEAVRAQISNCDVAVFCAAVADYRPIKVAPEKVKKSQGVWTLDLERTRDILGSVRDDFRFDGVVVGFAAETCRLEEYAEEKLRRKGCDMIVANLVGRVGTGFGSEENELLILFSDGRRIDLPRQSKRMLAFEIIRLVEDIAAGGAQRIQRP